MPVFEQEGKSSRASDPDPEGVLAKEHALSVSNFQSMTIMWILMASIVVPISLLERLSVTRVEYFIAAATALFLCLLMLLRRVDSHLGAATFLLAPPIVGGYCLSLFVHAILDRPDLANIANKYHGLTDQTAGKWLMILVAGIIFGVLV